MRKKKIYTFPGFTLIEVVIAMMIAGILITFAIKIITSILSIASSENKSSSQNNEILILHTFLNDNFLNSSRVQNPYLNEIDFIYSTKDTSKMSFHPFGIVISKVHFSDTLRLDYQNLEILKINDSASLISKISFSISCNNLNYNFIFKKAYTYQEMINDTN